MQYVMAHEEMIESYGSPLYHLDQKIHIWYPFFEDLERNPPNKLEHLRQLKRKTPFTRLPKYICECLKKQEGGRKDLNIYVKIH